MTIYNFDIKDQELDLEKYTTAAVPTGGNSSPVEPGNYAVIIRGITEREYKAGYKGSSEKYNYVSFRPEVEVINEGATSINRQDLTFGCLDDNGRPYCPDGSNDNPIFKGAKGAFSLLTALQVISGANGQFTGNFAPDAIKNQVVGAWISVAAWCKSEKEMEPGDLAKALTPYNGGKAPRSLDEFTGALALYNKAQGRTGDAEWKLKNYIIKFFIPSADMLEGHDLFISADGRVWTDEDAYDANEHFFVSASKPAGPKKPGTPSKPTAPKPGKKL